jgi:S-adenosylmethionine hydrolase
MKPIISLLTDFGLNDSYVGEVKAVIFSLCPDAEVVDITHEVRRFDVRMGAFLLASATPYFPKGTVHFAVVDPGVGGSRRPIVIETRRARYVGPDNGLLIPAAESESILHVYEVTNRSLMMETISSTFHGRDIFAPATAKLACGTTTMNEVGVEISDYARLSFGKPKFDKGKVTCEVIHIDSFGNVVTNMHGQAAGNLNGRLVVKVDGRRFRVRMVNTYSELKGKEVGALVGGHGYFEISCRESSAAKRLKIKSADALQILIS